MRRSVPALGHGDLATSIVLVFPLLLAYQVGVMFTPTLNGVDFVTRSVFELVGRSRDRYLLVQLVLALGFVAYVAWLRGRRTFNAAVVLPVVFEAGVYALTLGTFIVLIMDKLLGFHIALAVDPAALGLGDVGHAVVASLGAGVHEELVFRLGLLGGGIAVLCRAGIDGRVALALAIVASAALFSAAHHVGPGSEPLAPAVFTYRFLAGIAFGLIFYFRSLAHAVYAHAFYDLYVMVIRP